MGLDVHKDTIAMAVAVLGRDEPVYRGEVAHGPRRLQKWLARLSAELASLLLLPTGAASASWG